MAKKVQLMTNAKEWQTVNGVEVLVDVPQEDIDPITDSSCVEIEGHRTLEETISQENMFTPEIVETKVYSKVGGVYHDNVVDGAYEEAILYGNTQVNLVESMTSDTKYIPHSFTSFQGNESKIGNYHNGRTNQVAPLVKGVTMVNLCQETSVTIPEGDNGGAIENIKSNTKYTLALDFTVQNTQKGFSIHSFKDDTYLETSMIRTGMGEKVKFTFTTHNEANRIFIVNNRGYGGEMQLDNIMVIEGDVTDLDLPFFKGMRSVELSRALTNLFDNNTPTNHSWTGVTNVDGTVTATSQVSGTWTYARFNITFKPNTSYVVMWDSLTYTQTGNANQTIAICYGNDIIANIDNNFTNKRSIIFNTGDRNPSDINLRIHATTSNTETGTTTVTGLRVFEYDDYLRSVDLQTIGYFSGTKYVSVRALETEGKNLYPYGDVKFTSEFASSWCDSKGNAYMAGDIASKSQARFLLRKGTYYLSNGSNSNVAAIQLVDDKENLLISPFTLTQDTYCTIRVKTIEANVATTVTNIQIERGETATTYEAYQSRYYKPRETEEIILRSLPNGVCDTFNLQTGELVQRIHSHVFDGATYELNFMNTPGEVSGDDVVGGWSSLYNMYAPKHNSFSVSCDIPTRQRTSTSDSDYVNKEFFMIGVNTFIISLSKTRLNDLSISQYLTRNPITVQYELAEPIITKLQTYNRVYSGQTNAPTSMGNNLSALTYYNSNYYLKVGNLSPVPAILEPITTIPYDVKLKPSTLYTIKYNRGGNSNSMKFDLGGSVVEKTNATDLGIVPEEFTVKTPAILSHEQLILSGTGYAHNFIVVEGDITGTELPYFEGMKDVKMPIVKNISRNLLNESSMRVFYESNIVIRTYDVFPCKPNTRYCFVSVGGEANCNWHVCKKDAHYERPENESVGITQYLGYSREIVTPQDCYYMCIHTGSSPTTDREVYDIKTAIYEGSFAECVNYGYEDYKENSVYAVQGEIGLSQDMFEVGAVLYSKQQLGTKYETMKSNDFNHRARLKDLISIKPNTVYNININNDKYKIILHYFDASEGSIQKETDWIGESCSIKTPTDAYKVSILLSYKNNFEVILNSFDFNAYQILELDSTINLRSLPNGVKDELNLLTGEYIQRVGEVVLDGKNNQFIEALKEQKGDYLKFGMQLNPTAPFKHNIYILNDTFNSETYGTSKEGQQEQIYIHAHSATNTELRVCILPSKLPTPDEIGFNSYLQSNPITVQYELAEPIISHVRLVSNNQEREVGVKLPNGVCDTYNPSTGITTVRVGIAELDGSEDEKFDSTIDVYNKENTIVFFAYQHTPLAKKHEDKSKGYPIYTNQFEYVDVDLGQTSGGMYMDVEGAYMAFDGNVCFSISKEKLKPFGFTDDMNTKIQVLPIIYKYLVQNPLKAWYELKYPQIQPDIVLPNGVHDEYNPETGVYTKRVGFIEFDGSKDEIWSPQVVAGNSTHCYASILIDGTISPEMKHMENADEVYIISDCFETVSRNEFRYDTTEIYVWSGRTVYVNMPQQNLTAIDLVSWRNYLSQNPIKLWYELQTPITYQLTPYFGLPQPYAYEDGYLIHDSAYPETTLPPEFKYKLVANRTGQIVQNGRKLQEHTTRLSNLEALIIEATIESLFNRELQLFELELMDIQLIEL